MSASLRNTDMSSEGEFCIAPDPFLPFFAALHRGEALMSSLAPNDGTLSPNCRAGEHALSFARCGGHNAQDDEKVTPRKKRC
jgi:hypothetical protein